MDTYYLDLLHIAAGSISGREHLRSGRDNQDSFAYTRAPEALVGVVCDGCGSMPFSGIGAHLGARWLVRSLTSQLETDPGRPFSRLLEVSQRELLDRLEGLAKELTAPGQNWQATAIRRFLFTIVGFVARETETALFACGDGVVSINGDAAELGPFPSNRPPYLAYGLLDDPSRAPDLQLLTTHPTRDLRELVIGTDGLLDWIHLPEPSEAPSLGDTLAHPATLSNPDFVRRRLTVAQRRGGPGALPDDTTLILVRRADG
jgi:hypothetical protein